MSDIPIPDFDDPKEIYAFLGLAMYNANLVESSLINLAVALNLNQAKVITQEIFEATFGEMEAKTLGGLLKATRTLTTIPSELEPILEETLKKRNFLAHGFFRDHAEELMFQSGQKEMIEELRSMIGLFKRADNLLIPLYSSIWTQYGVTESFIESELERAYAEAERRYNEL
ncbi:hypothetical protein ACK345_02795 [Aeromonas rivipollensis]|uniref:hypothetical protein n=1 Tax=Aeromonas rivipollensis TaxID=948519 RepID=UPI0039863C4E